LGNEKLWVGACVQVWAVKSYTKSVPLYIQVLQRNSLQLIAPFLDPEHDVIVSMEQTRHHLLALSCLCPGASTLIGQPLGILRKLNRSKNFNGFFQIGLI